jgi:hypothetical protein
MQLLAAHRATCDQVHDANIVATTLDYGLRRLLTFNVANFRRFSPLIDPLLRSPPALPAL